MNKNVLRIINAPENKHRAAATARAIRKCQSRALEIADEADMDGRHGIARALRRKVASPNVNDITVKHLSQNVRVTITAYGVSATGDARG